MLQYRIHDLIEPRSNGKAALYALREGEYPPDPEGDQPPPDVWLHVEHTPVLATSRPVPPVSVDFAIDRDVACRLVRQLLPLCGRPSDMRPWARGIGYTWDSDRVTLAAELLGPIFDDVLGEDEPDPEGPVDFGNEPF